MGGIKKTIVRKVVNYLTRHLIRALTEDDILIITNNRYFLGKRKLTDEEIGTLKQEAKDFSKSFLWELMRRDIQFLAYMRGSRKAKDANDIIFSNAMYYDLEIIETFINRIKQL